MKIGKEEIVLLENLYEESKKIPDRALFISVIFQALLDATKPKKQNESRNIELQRDQASAWFAASVGVTCENFETVCSYAGLSSKYVRIFASHVINSDEKEFVRNKIIKMLG